MNKNAAIPLEWFFETLNKRVGPPYNLDIKDLFLCVPYSEEADFKFEIGEVFRKNYLAAQGNNLKRDYPRLHSLLSNSNKKVSMRVFFIHPDRLAKPLILWHKKFPYPKINRVKPFKSLLIN